MKKTKILINGGLDVSSGVVIRFTRHFEVEHKDMADALRQYVYCSVNVDDACCDWFYSESEGIIFIGDPGWIVSRDPMLIQIMKTADLISCDDFSAEGNGFSKGLKDEQGSNRKSP